MRRYYIVSCGLSGSTIFFHHTSLLARSSRGGGKLLNIKCVFRFSINLWSETFLILSRIQRLPQMFTSPRAKQPLFFSDFSEIRNFLNRYSKNTQISNFMKICPVGAELLQTEGQTATTTVTAAFRKFCEPARKWYRSTQACVTVATHFRRRHRTPHTTRRRMPQ